MPDLNTPPMMPPDGWPPMDPAAAVARATEVPIPQMAEPPQSEYELQSGLINARGELIRSVTVRELNGFDEEEMARLDWRSNMATYVTKMLLLAVETIGGEKPDIEVIRSLLVGDRDELVLCVRRTTYGDMYEFDLDCPVCEGKSKIGIDISKEIEHKELEDPLIRNFDIKLRNGMAKVKLLTGTDQEAFSENLNKNKAKTAAEIDTLMLARSVFEINGQPTFGDENMVRRLSAADRATLLDFVATQQPGPQLQTPIPVNCATCGKEYPMTLGFGDLFRI